MKAELNINGQTVSFNGTLEELATLLKQPKTSWSYKYIDGSDGWLNIVASDDKFYVGWGLSPRESRDDWTWLNDHQYAVYDFNSLEEAIEYAKNY